MRLEKPQQLPGLEDVPVGLVGVSSVRRISGVGFSAAELLQPGLSACSCPRDRREVADVRLRRLVTQPINAGVLDGLVVVVSMAAPKPARPITAVHPPLTRAIFPLRPSCPATLAPATAGLESSPIIAMAGTEPGCGHLGMKLRLANGVKGGLDPATGSRHASSGTAVHPPPSERPAITGRYEGSTTKPRAITPSRIQPTARMCQPARLLVRPRAGCRACQPYVLERGRRDRSMRRTARGRQVSALLMPRPAASGCV